MVVTRYQKNILPNHSNRDMIKNGNVTSKVWALRQTTLKSVFVDLSV